MRATRTYLQLSEPAQFRAALGDFPDLNVERVPQPSPSLYRQCYRTVGAAYGWRDRWEWSDAEIRSHLADPAVTFHVATRAGALAGYYELRRLTDDDSVEVASCGLVPEALGRGLGKHLLSCAVRDAWALRPPPNRVWLHTCTLDHPNALPNYVARGFVPYKTEQYEVDSAT